MSDLIETPAGPARLKRTQRRTLAISVLPDGSLELVAPMRAELEAIRARGWKRFAWIRAQRNAFRELNAIRPARRFVNGATHRYLGRQYRLKIVRGETARVKLSGAYFQVSVPNIDETEIEKALQKWFRERAQEVFRRRVAAWEQWCRYRKLPIPKARLRTMSKRWGSAHRNGTISLNPDLVRVPSICIDYVITHEICHLVHPNHGPAFYRLLTSLCPKWREIKGRLERAEF